MQNWEKNAVTSSSAQEIMQQQTFNKSNRIVSGVHHAGVLMKYSAIILILN